jgi:phage-related minor tail protein
VAEGASTGGGSGQKVGEIYYEVALDTSKMLDGQRQAAAALNSATAAIKQEGQATDKLQTSLTAAAQAAKLHVAQTQVAAVAMRDAAKAAADAAAASTKLGDASKKAGPDLGKQAISAKQLSAAMRGVPAQFTDIATSIAAGQSPLQVLLQQGGQLKDMFGGIGPAARALGSYVLELINPFTVAAAAAGAFLVGLVKGSQEMQDFNRALVLTGNISGVTGEQLNGLAERLDNVAGVTRSQAAEALTIFAELGIRGQESLGRFTEAALRLEQAGGPAIEETAKRFKDLERAPLQASLKLNESVNFLTADLYRQIKALDEQGKHVEAAKVAQDAYADALLARAPAIVENVGLIERAWRGVKNAAREGWDALLGIGRSQTPEDALKGTRQRIADLQNQLETGGFSSTGGGAATGRGLGQKERAEKEALLAVLQDQVRLSERGVLAAREAAGADADRAKQVAAIAEFDKSGQKFLTDRQRMELEIVQARELGVKAGLKQEQIEQRIAAIRKSYEKGGGGSKFDANAYIDSLRRASLEGEELLAARRDAELADAGKRKLTAEQLAAARLAIEQKYNTDVEKLYEKNRETALHAAEERRKAIEDAGKAESRQREQDQGFAAGVIAEDDPASQARLQYEQTLQRLELARQRDIENDALYSEAIVANAEALQRRLDEIGQRRVDAERDVQMETLAAVSNTTGLMLDVLQRAGKEKTAVAKAAFLAQKAIAVAEIILNAERGAANALGMGPFGIPLSTYIRASGYASAAVVAGLAIGEVAGGRQYGGPVSANSLYRVNETGKPEMYTASNGAQYMMPTKNGKVTAADKVGAGGAAPTVIIQNMGTPQQVQSQSYDSQSNTLKMVIADLVDQFSSNSGPVYNAAVASTNMRGRL